MTFLNPLDALIPKIPFSIFCRILGPGQLRGPGVSLGEILGGPSIKPFFGIGGGLARGLYRPTPPPKLKARPPPVGGYPGNGPFSPAVVSHQFRLRPVLPLCPRAPPRPPCQARALCHAPLRTTPRRCAGAGRSQRAPWPPSLSLSLSLSQGRSALDTGTAIGGPRARASARVMTITTAMTAPRSAASSTARPRRWPSAVPSQSPCARACTPPPSAARRRAARSFKRLRMKCRVPRWTHRYRDLGIAIPFPAPQVFSTPLHDVPSQTCH